MLLGGVDGMTDHAKPCRSFMPSVVMDSNHDHLNANSQVYISDSVESPMVD